MKTFKKVMKWIGIVLGGLILAVIAVNLILNIVFGKELRATLRELKAQGVPLTVAEITPPPVPDADNAAPLVTEALARIPAKTNTTPNSLKSLVAIIETNSGPGKVCTDIAGWTETQQEEGAELIQSEEVKEWYALLEKAALRPRYNNNLDYSQGPGMIIPNLGPYRTAVRLLAVKAGFEVQAGNTNQALNTILTGLTLSNKLSEEPTLITQLVRVACDMILIDGLERLAVVTELPADSVHSLINELSLHTDTTPWVRIMDAERVCMGLWIYDKYISGLMAAIKSGFLVFQLDVNTGANPPIWIISVAMPILKKDCAIYLRLLSKIQRNFELPYYQIADTMKLENQINQIPRYAVITRLILPSLNKIIEKAPVHQAEVEVCRVGLALKLYKQKFGAYPDALDKLAPEFMESIPVDPFTGKPLVYRKAGDGFLLYSLGPNRKDDGGKPRARFGKISEDSDIVWKCEK